MPLIKTAAQILQGRPRPVDVTSKTVNRGKGRGGQPALHRKCTLPDCSNPHHSNGLCQSCGYRMDRWGDPRHVFKRVGVRGGVCGCDNCVAGITKRMDRD